MILEAFYAPEPSHVQVEVCIEDVTAMLSEKHGEGVAKSCKLLSASLQCLEAVPDMLVAALDDPTRQGIVKRLEEQVQRFKRGTRNAEPETDQAVSIDTVEALARQECHTEKVEKDYMGQVAGTLVTDSGAITCRANSLRLLANHNRFRIVAEYGRMVVGYWPENDPQRETRNAECATAHKPGTTSPLQP